MWCQLAWSEVVVSRLLSTVALYDVPAGPWLLLTPGQDTSSMTWPVSLTALVSLIMMLVQASDAAAYTQGDSAVVQKS